MLKNRGREIKKYRLYVFLSGSIRIRLLSESDTVILEPDPQLWFLTQSLIRQRKLSLISHTIKKTVIKKNRDKLHEIKYNADTATDI